MVMMYEMRCTRHMWWCHPQADIMQAEPTFMQAEPMQACHPCLQEAGATPMLELAFTIADGLEYIRCAQVRPTAAATTTSATPATSVGCGGFHLYATNIARLKLSHPLQNQGQHITCMTVPWHVVRHALCCAMLRARLMNCVCMCDCVTHTESRSHGGPGGPPLLLLLCCGHELF